MLPSGMTCHTSRVPGVAPILFRIEAGTVVRPLAVIVDSLIFFPDSESIVRRSGPWRPSISVALALGGAAVLPRQQGAHRARSAENAMKAIS